MWTPDIRYEVARLGIVKMVGSWNVSSEKYGLWRNFQSEMRFLHPELARYIHLIASLAAKRTVDLVPNDQQLS